MTLDMTGDSMKFYEHVDLPLTDAIHFYGHGRPGFKLVTSAASNYDKPRVYCETYGNFRGREVDGHLLYMTAMELFARLAGFDPALRSFAQVTDLAGGLAAVFAANAVVATLAALVVFVGFPLRRRPQA